MADSHEERRRELIIKLTETFRLLRAALADLPIPIQIAPSMASEPEDVDRMLERAREALQDEPMHEGARTHLDMAILAFASAFDVAHIAHHREAMQWRYDGTLFLLGQTVANITLATLLADEES
ncbi:hypothetical protein [Nonomuraea aridisoli]|uniref:Uncharacterized protein n=1 Tax=Nonomuraea aridisoli TaxID=2070368 RepID=A0A2W2FG65_9ACTN|nr:hypothetical protein [Nonomuraea aridisoli]PZG20617.1 hypothetical protein C1J01_08940 [Nonomuraea aridisoli]